MRRFWPLLLAISVTAVTLLLYWPVLGLALIGDDYQWIQHARHALHRPILLLADLDSFYRPASTWTLALDHLIWGWSTVGFRLTNLALHAAAAILLAGCARRLGLGITASNVIGLVWVSSPFTFEPAASVAIRFENLLLISWCLLILAWPGREERFTRGRLAAIGGILLLAAASKETWVVTPALVLALEWAQRRVPLLRSLRSAALATVPAALYTITYFIVFPGDKSYYRPEAGTLWKIPHELAAFLHLEALQPVAFRPTFGGVLALVAVLGMAAFAFKRRAAAGMVGLALLLAPTLPTLLVPYLPTRYTAIPYAGFLLLIAAALTLALRGLENRKAQWAGAAALVVAGMVLVAGSYLVRADIDDFRRVAEPHELLVAEARAVMSAFPLDRPVLSVRAERINPLVEIAGSPRGQPKLLFPRGSDPYALIDTAALFEWAAAQPDLLFHNVPAGRAVPPAALLWHRPGGFTWGEAPVQQIPTAAEQLREQGLPVRVIQALGAETGQ